MSRHITFRYCLDATVEQQQALTRHAGAARFAYNQCLDMVKTALAQRKIEPAHPVPFTAFSLINAFNAWKKSEDAGRVFVVDPAGDIEVIVTGLRWRDQVYQQVFEEAAVNCGRGLAAWSDSRSGKRTGPWVGFPRFTSKSGAIPSFRLRNRHPRGGRAAIRVGDDATPRSVTLPGIGTIRVREDTRRLRRMLAGGRAKILNATITRRAGRWQVSLSCEAADLHPARQHRTRAVDDLDGWVGIDRGLSAFVVAATADGHEVARITAPTPLKNGLPRLRRLSKALSRKEKGSVNRARAAARLGRHHHRIANTRRHFLHGVVNELVKTHDRLVVEDLHVAGMLRNRRLSREISDAGWGEFARILDYKLSWRGGEVITADRWFASSKTCSACGGLNTTLTLADRIFTCGCGFRADRDVNAAINLALWARARDPHRSPDPQAGGRATNARRREGAGRHPCGVGETVPVGAGTDAHALVV
ncbi:RNA-guided endonuclease TnpB family protein [Nocardia sp. NPDC059764]|uniref:RNA-guided endonuclease TnpB family protein n=1 Tax=Nocardia sp. NPDC059764 TaxID=3346939 RepID=UPI003651C129